jgi:HAD superfamily hydrolase (TIGR01450 family)
MRSAADDILDRLARARGWIFDIDGTLMRTAKPGGEGGSAFPGAADLLERLRAKGRRVLVCTQASTRPPAAYANILSAAGCPMEEDDVMTAGLGAALYLKDRYPGATILVLGSDGLTDPLKGAGLRIASPEHRGTIDAVMVGYAPFYESRSLDLACTAILGGAGFYTTTDEYWFHGGLGRSLAPSGFIALALGTVCGRTAQILGKPSAALGGVLLARLGLEGRDVVVVDDNLGHGIRLAHVMGALSVMPLSGASTRTDADAVPPDEAPSLICSDVGELYTLLESRLTAAS